MSAPGFYGHQQRALAEQWWRATERQLATVERCLARLYPELLFTHVLDEIILEAPVPLQDDAQALLQDALTIR